MNYNILLLLGFSFVLLNCSSSQQANESNVDTSDILFIEVDMSDYYDQLGVIIPEEYENVDELLKELGIEKRFTPTLQEVQKAEKILYREYNQYRNSQSDSEKKIYRDLDDVQLYLKNYPRQYFGYLDKDSNNIVLINLLLTKEAEARKRRMANWNNRFVLVIDESGRGTSTFKANLDQNTLQ